MTLASGLEKQRDARAHLYDGKDADTVQNLQFEHVAKIFCHVRQTSAMCGFSPTTRGSTCLM